MSFPPPPPPPRPPPPPVGNPPSHPNANHGNNSLVNGMSNLHVSRTGNQQQQYGFQQHPPQPAPAQAQAQAPQQQQSRFMPPPPSSPYISPPPPNNLHQHQPQHPRPPPPSPYPGVPQPPQQIQSTPPPPPSPYAVPQQQQVQPPLPPQQNYRQPPPAAYHPASAPAPAPAQPAAAAYGGYPQQYAASNMPPSTPPAPRAPPPYHQGQVAPPPPLPPQPSFTPGGYPPRGPPPTPGNRLPPGPPPPPPGRPLPPNYHQQQHQSHPPPPQQHHQQQHQPKIDPSQIPRPPLFTRPNDNGPLPIYSPKAASAQTRIGPPPPADSRYLVNDDGNASPQLIRSNLYTIPSDRSTWQKMGEIDIGVMCSPMALPGQDYMPTLGPQPDEGSCENNNNTQTPTTSHQTRFLYTPSLDPQRIPLVQGIPRGGKGAFAPPPRCRNCAAYVNPYWGMDTNTCNFCGTKNATHKDFDVLCLQRGTVDYEVDGPYITRATPVQPIFLYALDLTCSHLIEYVELLEQVGIDLGRHFQQQPAQQALRQQQQQKQQQDGRTNDDPASHTDPTCQKLLQQRPRIGICFVASFGVVVLTRNGPQGTPLSLVMPDITMDSFCHVPIAEWTFDLSTVEGVDKWTQHIQEDLLEGDMLKQLRKEAGKKNAYGLDGFELSCGGAAMAFCADALAESGGRATWISSRRPNFGAGYIRNRTSLSQSRKPLKVEDVSPIQNVKNPTNKEDEAAGKFYQQLQEKCTKARVVLDIIIHSNPQHVAYQQLEMTTQQEICRATSGKLTWIAAPGMGWKEPMAEELKRPLMCFQGWDTVFKVRCSEGLQVKSFISHPGTVMDGGGLAASPELELSCVTPQTNLAVVLEHKIGCLPKKQPFAFVQSALLYSTPSGQRRVRVSTLALRPSLSIPDIFLSFDFTTFTTLFLRRAVAMLQGGIGKATGKEDLNALHRQTRDDILQQIVKLLVSYRQHTNAINSPRGQLILPEKLQLLPLFTMCLLKSTMLRPSLGRRLGQSVVISPSNDERAYYAFQAMMVGPAAAFLLVHPNVFGIGELTQGAGEWRTPPGIESALSELSKASYHSFIQLPPTVNASMTCLQDDGIYLIDNGLVIYMFFGKDVPEHTKKELYHVPISLSLPAASNTLTKFGERVRRVVWQLRCFCSVSSDGSRSQMRPTFAPIIPVWQGNQNHLLFEQDLMNCMVDDPNAGEKDYTEFLVKLHRLIREKVEPATMK